MIIVFGSLNADLVFQVEQFPEAGETVICPEYHLYPGGKGANQALAAACDAGHVYLAGCTGDDDFGSMLRQSLQQGGVNPSLIQTGTIPTGSASIIVDSRGENMITVACGANAQASQATIPTHQLDVQTTVLMQMETPLNENWALIKRAHDAGARTILNLAPANTITADILTNLDVLICNEGEARCLAQQLDDHSSNLQTFLQNIADGFQMTCILTLGARGAIAVNTDGVLKVEAMRAKVVDTTAAGDTFAGVLAANLDRDASLLEAMHRASVASGLACEKAGAQTSVPRADAIDAAMHRVPRPCCVREGRERDFDEPRS